MSDLIDRQAAIDAMLKLQAEDEELYGCRIPEGFDGDRAKEALEQLPSAEPEIIRCKDCKHFEYDHPYIIQGIPVLGHEVCNAWGDGCKTENDLLQQKRA